MSEAKFQESLKSEGYSFEEYRKRLREQIIISRIVTQQVRNKVLVNDQDIDAFLRDNKNFEGAADKYRIRQILFKQPADAADRPNIEERAQAVYARISQGEDFGALAKEYSEDPTRNSGGDLGFIERNSLAKEFGSALSQMKPGDVSRPFWTSAGLHIIKYEAKSEKKSPKKSGKLRGMFSAISSLRNATTRGSRHFARGPLLISGSSGIYRIQYSHMFIS